MTSCLPILNLKGLFLSLDESNFFPFWSIPVKTRIRWKRAVIISQFGLHASKTEFLFCTNLLFQFSPSDLLPKEETWILPYALSHIQPINKSFIPLESPIFSISITTILGPHRVTILSPLCIGITSNGSLLHSSFQIWLLTCLITLSLLPTSFPFPAMSYSVTPFSSVSALKPSVRNMTRRHATAWEMLEML